MCPEFEFPHVMLQPHMIYLYPHNIDPILCVWYHILSGKLIITWEI